MEIELHWFDECPNHSKALAMLEAAMKARGLTNEVTRINIGDPVVAEQHRSPGSPTIRINKQDIEPAFEDSGEYSPRCRLYLTSRGLTGVPDPAWIEQALDAAGADV